MFTYLTQESLTAFLAILRDFDCHYRFSDDPKVYAQGRAQEARINGICKNDHFKAVYEAWETYKQGYQTLQTRQQYEDALQQILKTAVATQPAIPVSQDELSLPIAQSSKELEPFGNAADLLQDPIKAKVYLQRRPSDLVDLQSRIRWTATDHHRAVKAHLFTLTIYMDVSQQDDTLNRIEAKTGTLYYKEQVCMLAYILAVYY